ncbi:MAG: glycosyltransferase [Candidatus Azobacteroides sp.]|nr:glycosyltransferase [Candidatus Azobacteroides sp.]
MKIAIVGSASYDTMEYHLNESFNYNGYQSQIFDLPPGYYITESTKLNGKIFTSMANEVDQYHPDLIMVVYRIVHPDFVIQVKKMGYKVIQVNPDALTTFDMQQLFAAEYDVYFTKDPYIQRFMESNLKLNVKLYHEAFNRRVHIKPDIDKLEYENVLDMDVVVYGSMYPYRNRMLRILADNDIDLTLFGNTNLPFYDPSLDQYNSGYYIAGETKAKILYGARIVLNNLHYAEIESVNTRFFEANGSGAFQLSDYRPILKDLLPIDPELVSFKSIDEAVGKIRYYLQHPEERVALAGKIYDHFINNYTYDHLIRHILNSI